MMEGDDGNRAEHQREQNGAHAHVHHHQAAEQHGGDQGHGIGFEQVCGHAGAITDVVADVIRDHRGVARVVLRDAGFDLADQVGADVGALGENAAAQAREDGNQRAAKGQSHQGTQRQVFAAENLLHQIEVAGHAEQP